MTFSKMEEVGQSPESAPVGQTSFEQVEQIVEAVKKEEAAEAKSEKATAKAIEKAVEKLKDAKDGDSEGAKDGPAKAEEAAAAKAEVAKLIKGFKGESTVELDPETEIEYKIHGKIERVKLADLRNNYSGKVNWDRKNNEFHAEKQKFESQIKTINERVDRLLKLAGEQPEAALIELAQLAGKTPEEYAKLLSANIEAAGRWNEMSDVERKALMAELENKGYKEEAKRRAEIAEYERREKERLSKIDETAKVLGLESDEVNVLVEDIRNHAGIQQPSSEHVYTAWVFKNVQDAFQGEAPDALASNPEIFKEASNVILSNGLTSKDDIRHIIREAYADDSTRKVGRKVAERAKTSQAPQAASAARQRELVSFDEI